MAPSQQETDAARQAATMVTQASGLDLRTQPGRSWQLFNAACSGTDQAAWTAGSCDYLVTKVMVSGLRYVTVALRYREPLFWRIPGTESWNGYMPLTAEVIFLDER